MKDRAKDGSSLAQWAKAGGEIADADTTSRDTKKEPLVVTFAATLPTPFTTQLRAAGLRWNNVMKHWEGLAGYDAVAALAGQQDGLVRRVRSADDTPKAPLSEKISGAN